MLGVALAIPKGCADEKTETGVVYLTVLQYFCLANKNQATMMSLPSDPMMLFSFVNMKLRDEYANLDALCDDMQVDKTQLMEKLADAGFEYSTEHNKFW